MLESLYECLASEIFSCLSAVGAKGKIAIYLANIPFVERAKCGGITGLGCDCEFDVGFFHVFCRGRPREVKLILCSVLRSAWIVVTARIVCIA